MSVITSVNAVDAIVKIVAVQALEQLSGTLVMGNLVNRNFEQALNQTGDTVNVPIAPEMEANNIAEGGTVTNQRKSLGNAQVVLNTHAEASFLIGDIAETLSNPQLAGMYMRSAILAIAERIETDLMSSYVLLTDQTVLGGAGVITESLLDDSETALFNARVPMGEPKYAVVTAGTYADIRQIPRFSEYSTTGDEGAAAAIRAGVVGRLKNLEIIRSHYTVQTSGPVSHNIVFSRDAFTLVTRKLPPPAPGTGTIASYADMGTFGMRVLTSYNSSYLSNQFTIDILYGIGTLRNNFGLELQTNT